MSIVAESCAIANPGKQQMTKSTSHPLSKTRLTFMISDSFRGERQKYCHGGIILHQRDWIRFVRSCFANHRRSIFIFTVTANCVGPRNIPEVICELLRLRKDGAKMVAVRVDT